MKFSHYQMYAILGIAFCGVSLLVGADIIPSGYPIARYSVLWKRSPFTIASVQQDVVPAGFASKLALAGIAKIGRADLVTLVNKESQERISVTSEPNALGIKLVSVEPNTDLLKASVTIQQGGETAKVRFDQSLLAMAAPAVSNSGAPQYPAQQAIPGPQPASIGSPPAPPFIRSIRRSLPIPAPYPGQGTGLPMIPPPVPSPQP